jgi:hypothetical protein
MAGVGIGFTIAALGLSAAGTGMSFAQASKQGKLRRKAEDEAAKSMEAAEKILETNYLKGISLPKETYEREREALLSSGEQALRAGAEAEGRGAAATAGRVQMAQQAGQRNIATAQADRLLELEMMGAKEDARLQTGLANLEMMGVAGAQQAARDAQMSQMQAVQQGFQGLKNMGKTALDYKNELLPLFQSKGPDFSSVGGNMVSQNAIAANPTLYGQYQGQNVFLPDVFGDGLNFTNSIDQVSTLPQLQNIPAKQIAPTIGG